MASILARENVLCRLCEKSASNSHLLPTLTKGVEVFRSYACHDELRTSSLDGCHLCSLFLGMFKCKVPQVGSSVEVRLRVSRSGGAWLAVVTLFPDSSPEESLGELSVFRNLEGRYEEPTLDAPFRFSTSTIYEHAQLSKSLRQGASAALAREWLSQCTRHHDRCRSSKDMTTESYPTRLIDVGDDEGLLPVRLVVTADLATGGPRPRYLTLSHCWGGADILKLLSNNIEDLRSNIPFYQLPRTFRDTIIITRQLGLVVLSANAL